jgi:IS6 family transposase
MNPFHGRHFQGTIILWAARWYCKYGISYRELQEMLAERCVNVDHTTIYRWFGITRQRWKNVCVGTGITLQIYAPGAS